MAGLRDTAQRSRKLYLPRLDKAPDAAGAWPAGPSSLKRSLPQRERNVGFSIRGTNHQSAWKRRFASRTTAPTETTVRTALLTRCAVLHSLGGIVLAGVLTVAFLESDLRGWLWLILLSMLVTIYSLSAYWSVEHHSRLSVARWLILGGDLTTLVCWWLLLGPSLVTYLIFPCLILLAAFLSGRRDMLLTAALGAAILVALMITDLVGVPHLQLQMGAVARTLLNLLGALACLSWIARALLALFQRSQQIGAADHWNSAEIARVRIESELHLRQLQDGLAMLQSVLGQVAGGNLHARVALKEGELAPLAARLNTFLDRQERMFDEARQHRQLEAAAAELLALLEALHRGERVGWPAPTGTSVDRILALMRAPSPPRTTTRLPVTTRPLDQNPGGTDVPASTTPRTRSETTPLPAIPPTFGYRSETPS